jgi:uncharacterized protein
MPGEKNLPLLLKTMKPSLHTGDYVFCTVKDISTIYLKDVIGSFREDESITLIISKENADRLNLSYSFVSAWITLLVHSSLEAVGLTAAFSNALAKEGISCNVIAAYYHDHIFVNKKDAGKAMKVLEGISKDP